jgi:hypothetical protein
MLWITYNFSIAYFPPPKFKSEVFYRKELRQNKNDYLFTPKKEQKTKNI